jgi:archaellum component FlaC
MSLHLKAFFADKAAQVAWAEFIVNELNTEALKRVYAGEDTKALKEAKEIIEQSFKKLNELFTPKKERKPVSRGE